MRRSGPRFSLGSLLMLALAAGVLALCALFVVLIGGRENGAQLGRLALSVQVEESGSPAAAPAATAAPVMQTASPQEGGAAAVADTETPAPAVSSFTLAAAGTVYAPKAIRESAMEGAEHYDF